eukprot:4407877-Amphidinium_carterae.1
MLVSAAVQLLRTCHLGDLVLLLWTSFLVIAFGTPCVEWLLISNQPLATGQAFGAHHVVQDASADTVEEPETRCATGTTPQFEFQPQ